MNLDELICENIKSMRPYESPPLVKTEVKLNQNELPLDMPKWLKERIISRLKKARFNRYNEGSSEELRKLLGRKFGVNPERIIVGAGIDELLYYVTLVFAKKGDKTVRFSPSFAMYKACAQLVGAEDIEFELSRLNLLEGKIIEQITDAKIIFLCRPNNPTGECIDKEAVEKIVASAKGIVCIDEAYAEFAEDNCIDFLRYRNVIILRTFSKAFGGAGIRVGYAIGDEEVIGYLNRIKLPWNLSIFSQIAAEESLKSPKWFEAKIDKIKKDREWLGGQLANIKGIKIYQSQANFILFKLKNSERIFERLAECGIAVRNFSSPALKDCLRTTVGTRRENKRFLKALKEAAEPEKELVIFDVDGVLVDVTNSYREAIRRTVAELTGSRISNYEIEKIKRIPGFNNDWDVSYALISGVNDPQRIDKTSEEYARIKEVFQGIYLGQKLFEKERMLIEEKTFAKLAERFEIGVVTSRPRKEALLALKSLMPKYLKNECIIALEDCEEEKPSPKPLLLLKKKTGVNRCFYVGDTVNDQLAAESAGMIFISVDPRIRAEFYIKNVNQILEVVENES